MNLSIFFKGVFSLRISLLSCLSWAFDKLFLYRYFRNLKDIIKRHVVSKRLSLLCWLVIWLRNIVLLKAIYHLFLAFTELIQRLNLILENILIIVRVFHFNYLMTEILYSLTHLVYFWFKFLVFYLQRIVFFWLLF